MAIIGIILFIVALLATVAIHELGHLVPAKLFGTKVSKYFIGFGPTLWSRTWKGTEFGIKAILLGGFVAIAHMLPPAPVGTRTLRKDGTLTLAEEARRASAAEIDEHEEHQAFWRLPARKKIVVMFGGPATNLVIAFLCAVVVVSGLGIPTTTTTVAEVVKCMPAAEAAKEADTASREASSRQTASACEYGVSPAFLAGFQPGDRITTWNGEEVSSWEQVQGAIKGAGTQQVSVTVVRNGAERRLSVQARETPRPRLDSSGQIVTDQDGEPRLEMKPYVGIGPAIERQAQPLGRAVAFTGELAWGTAKIVLTLPAQLWNTVSDLFTGEPRDANSVVGVVGVAQMAGSITSVEADQYTLSDRVGDFVMLIGSLNMSLFVFNMLPLLPLDGGHILGALIEGARRHWARRRGKPDPGAFDTAKMLPLSYAVIVFFIAMTLLLVVADLINPVV
ncbi:MAG: M50 family metallopeptidase [Actinomycetaceae bacterium]|nr:site-2 protease family protein [Arcanobacterium sp.]MDD7504516.1 M50 family metallopeptidase [Actinomycetaceae bacterium]MDY6142815.1 M50 family metallopeptidase [Arcanobacterium sp.]